MKIIVVGGGAAGLVAAIEAAGGASVRILEKMKKPGKKILVTGNGRCNLTNEVHTMDRYRSDHPELVFPLIRNYGCYFTRRYFENLGIRTVNRDGYIYPASGQAETVANALVSRANAVGVLISAGCSVTEIEKKDGGFRITYQAEDGSRCCEECDRVILAAGGQASPRQGSDGSGFLLAGRLGHTILQPLPALVPLHTDIAGWKQAAGVRTAAGVTLLVDQEPAARETGELQFADYGLSGIPVFQISRYAVAALSAGKRVTASVDLFPFDSLEEVGRSLSDAIRNCPYKTMEELMEGFLNWKLARFLLRQWDIPLRQPCTACGGKQINAIAARCKRWEIPITGYHGFEQAQATQGGVDLREVHMDTMESRLVPGLYFAGEILDVDGTCGGYNLQWAWTSGYIAGRESAGGRK